jgi:phospholipid/cholesterol/gamma-HCH transport system substrate-binding protein
VKIEIDGGVVIREKYRVAVCNLSMLGGNYLLLEEGVGEPIDYTSVMLSGETPSDWMRDISAIAKNIKAVTEMKEGKGIVTNFEAAAEKASRLADTANRIADRVERGEGTVGKLLSKDDTLHDEIKDSLAAFRKAVSSFDLGDTKGGISNLVANADKLMVNLNAVADKIKKGEGTLGKLTSDSELYDEANALVKDIRQVVDNYRDSTPITTFSSLIMGGL